MKQSLVLSIVSIALGSLQGTAVAADVFDSPGPGYHQQIDSFAPTKVGTGTIRVQVSSRDMRTSGADRIRFEAPSVSVRQLNVESLLSQPIRLTLGGPKPAIVK